MAVARRALLRMVLAAAGGLSLAGCTLDIPPAPEPVASAAPSSRTSGLPIGAVLSLSGRFSREGMLMKAGYETWAAATRDAGGVALGGSRAMPDLRFIDDESEPLVAGRAVERMVGQDRIALVLGPFTSQITTAVATAIDRLGAVLVAPDAGAPALYRRGLRGLFSILPPDDRLFHGLADLAALADPRAQPVGVVVADEPTLATATDGLRERAGALGLGPVFHELIGLGTADISAPLERLAARRPRVLLVAVEDQQTARLAVQARELMPDVGMRAFVPFPRMGGDRVGRPSIFEGALTVGAWSPALTTHGPVLGSTADFVERFRRLHGYEPDPRSAAAAAAGVALQLAVEAAGSPDPMLVRASLSGLDVMTFWGRLAWDTLGRNRRAVPPVLQQQGDGLVAVYPPELASGRLRYPLASWPRP